MAYSQDIGLLKDSLLADVLRNMPGLIEQLALCLDREMRSIPYWKHLSAELRVDTEVITGLEQYTDFSPTIRLFEYLEITQPSLTIQQLKQALFDIRRNDLFSLLTTQAGCVDSEMVREVITSAKNTQVHSPRVGLLDEIALALDVRSQILSNWISLARELGVPRKIFKQFERRSTQSPTNQLFEYLSATRPRMTLKALKEALERMNRNDLLEILQNQKGELLIRDVMKADSDILQVVADGLNTDPVPWAQNWRKLAYYLKIPSDVYQGFGETTPRKSPTKEVLQWLVVRTPDITLIDIVQALEKIQRNDAIQIITQQFPDTVDYSLAAEQLSSSLNDNLDFALPSTPTAESSFTPKTDEFARGSFLKQEDFKKPGHCGSLPDGPYVLKGREDTCKQIITSLELNKAVEVVAPPGYGKTSVVVEAAHRLINNSGKFVAYVNPRGVTCVEDLGSKIIEALDEVPGENTIRGTLRRIRSLKGNNVVIIIENIDDLLHLEDNQERECFHDEKCCSKMRGKHKKDDFLTFIKGIGQIKTIDLVLTSTETNDFSVFFPIELIELQPLSERDSSALFKESDNSLDEATVKELVNICLGIPLIIRTVLSLFKKTNPQKLTHRLSSLAPLKLMKELSHVDLPHEDRIDRCLEVCFCRLSQDEQDVLVMLSTFPHRFTQKQFFSVFRSATDLDLETCIDFLKHSSLLCFERESCYLCIHPFIRKFCSVQLKHKEAKSLFVRHYSDFVVALSKTFLSKDSKLAVERYRDEKVNIREAVAWCEDEHPDLDQDLKEYCIDAFNKAALFLAKVMRKQEFESIFCLFSHHCRYDLQRQSACLTVIGMKIVLSCTCRPQICSRAWYRANNVLSRANEIQSSLKTVDDATRAQCLSKLGFCCVREGRVHDGFEYLNQALTLLNKRCEQSSKKRNKVMWADCNDDLAASMMLQRKHMASIETRISVVLPIYKMILGNHPFVATTLSWIARSYHELGEYDRAIEYATQALNIQELLLGRHQETARSYYDLGVALSAKKDYERALRYLDKAVELQEAVLDTFEELIRTHQAMAIVLKELGRDDEAEREMERAGKYATNLDSFEVPLQIQEVWPKTDPVSDSVEPWVPSELRLRGRSALEAYHKALTEGKTCVRRVPVMLIGQNQSGKTNLKKSLMGKPFNPDEDSTVGIDAYPSYFKVTTEIWETGENALNDQATQTEAISFEYHAARLVPEHLKEEKGVIEEGGMKSVRSRNIPLVDTVSSNKHVGSELSLDVPSSSSHNSAQLPADVTKFVPSSETLQDITASIQISQEIFIQPTTDEYDGRLPAPDGGPAEDQTTKPCEMINIETACLKFQAEHEECVRVLPQREVGQVVVHFYVFRESGVPENLKAAAQIYFGEKVKLKWSDLYNDSVNILNARPVEYPCDKPRRLNASQVDEISEIISKNLHVFSKHRNVTAVQASFKVTKSKQTETPCIAIYVLGKGYIPLGESELPRNLGPYPVDVVDGFWFTTSDAPSNPNNAQESSKALLLGASIGVQGVEASGSLGAIVKDEDSGKWYALSCDHVMNHSENSEIIHPGLDDHMEYLRCHLNEYGTLIKKITVRKGLDTKFTKEKKLIADELISKKFQELKSIGKKHCDSSMCKRNALGRMEQYEKCIETGLEPPRVIGNYTAGVRRNVKWNGKEYFVDCAISQLNEDEVTLLKESEDEAKLIGTEKYPSGECKPATTDAIMGAKSLCKSGKTSRFTTQGRVVASVKPPVYLAESPLCEGSPDSKALFNVAIESKVRQACAVERSTQTEAALPPYEDSASVQESLWRKNCLCIAPSAHGRESFSKIGDSGAVIFEESDDVHAMPGFGIIFGLLETSHHPYTLASPLQVALEALSKKQGFKQNLKLVSEYDE